MIRALNFTARKIAFVGSFPPRRCGIAMFTSDLINNIEKVSNGAFCAQVFAMDSGLEHYYQKPVSFTIDPDSVDDYLGAADYVNYSDIDIVSIQHEFGLFGGNAGAHLLEFMNNTAKPIFTTLHTVLQKPDENYYNSMMGVCKASEKIIVMNQKGVQMLQDIYNVSPAKIELISHGIPDLPKADAKEYKSTLGIGNRKVILTAGFLSRNKGIECMLSAMPKVLDKHPDALYIVLGATHPNVARVDGLEYYHSLLKLVEKLSLKQNVEFHHHYVKNDKLFGYLCAADIYVTPYKHEQQITSGSLIMAMGTGRAVVSTPYWAAQELLAERRGKLVHFGDSGEIADAVTKILSDEEYASQMRERAYQYGRSITWPKIARKYIHMFESVCSKPIYKAVGPNTRQVFLTKKRTSHVNYAKMGTSL